MKELIEIAIPGASSDQIQLRLEIDRYHYHLDQSDHVQIAGSETAKSVNLIDTNYYAQVTGISDAIVYGSQPITITGQSIDRASGTTLANVPVKLVFSSNGFERVETIISNSTGDFEYLYTPSNKESGRYQVSAIHPDMVDRPNHGEFIIQVIEVKPQDFKLNIPKNYDLNLDIQIKTGKQTPLTGLRLEYRAQDQANGIAVEGISVSITEPIDIAADSTAYLRPVFKAEQTAAQSGQIRLRVISDDNLADSLGFVSVNYTLSAAEPSLFIGTPGYIETGVGLEQSITEQLTISNKGLAELNNVQLSLTQSDGSSAAPNWIYIASANNLATMAVGSNETINVTANPSNSVAEADYEFRLKISSNELADIFIPIYVAVTQSGIGNAFFHAADIYTATLDQYGSPIPGLTSARIKLQNEQVLTQEYNVTTDANGEALFADIPAGRYIFRASAADHQDVSGRIYIKPGITVAEEIFLMNQIITVEFSVTEITLEDRYEILLQATYETSVPVAVVVSEPASVNLPVMKKGEIFLGEIRLTNYGLIRAYDIASQIPTNSPLINFEFLHQPPEAIEAGEVIVLPYRIIALNDFNPTTAGDGTGGGSCGFQFAACLDNSCRCVNGYIVNSSACTAFDANWGGCEGSSSTPTITNYTYRIGGGNGGGNGGGRGGSGGSIAGKGQSIGECTAAGGGCSKPAN